MDYSTAKASNLTAASVENKAGKFVAPSTTAASAAAAGVTVKPDLTFHAVWASTDPTAYPITYQSWDIVYATQPNANDVLTAQGLTSASCSGQQGQALLDTARLRTAAVQHRLDGHRAAQPDHLVTWAS